MPKIRIIDLEVAIKMWTKQLSHIRKLIIPVIANICLTLFAWVYVYKMELDENNFAFYLFDSRKNVTTGNELYDGILNGFSSILLLAIVSFCMLAFALYDFKRVVQSWLTLSCILIMFGVFSGFCVDALKVFEVDDPDFILATVLTTIYGGLGCLVFFTSLTPLCLHQFYVISNCSLVSLFYLRSFPGYTAWFVLSTIVIWDIFAVLTPMGPLSRAMEKAGEYSDGVLRMLMFEAKDNEDERGESVEEEESADSEEEDGESEGEEETEDDEGICIDGDLSTAETISLLDEGDDAQNLNSTNDSDLESIDSVEYVEFEVTKSKSQRNSNMTALDALQDSDSAHLGMGDFVFYSVLVGKAATFGSILSTVSTTLGVIIGLFVTLAVVPNDDTTCPALPISIVFGMALHFGIFYIVQPFLDTVYDVAPMAIF